ncbi:hypothetical protein HDU67_002268 [Dinochytrium kinnereticum]|nr:hypothetical protein HDU67_002268 [Dinochytrium kinnereticum]
MALVLWRGLADDEASWEDWPADREELEREIDAGDGEWGREVGRFLGEEAESWGGKAVPERLTVDMIFDRYQCGIATLITNHSRSVQNMTRVIEKIYNEAITPSPALVVTAESEIPLWIENFKGRRHVIAQPYAGCRVTRLHTRNYNIIGAGDARRRNVGTRCNVIVASYQAFIEDWGDGLGNAVGPMGLVVVDVLPGAESRSGDHVFGKIAKAMGGVDFLIPRDAETLSSLFEFMNGGQHALRLLCQSLPRQTLGPLFEDLFSDYYIPYRYDASNIREATTFITLNRPALQHQYFDILKKNTPTLRSITSDPYTTSPLPLRGLMAELFCLLNASTGGGKKKDVADAIGRALMTWEERTPDRKTKTVVVAVWGEELVKNIYEEVSGRFGTRVQCLMVAPRTLPSDVTVIVQSQPALLTPNALLPPKIVIITLQDLLTQGSFACDLLIYPDAAGLDPSMHLRLLARCNHPHTAWIVEGGTLEEAFARWGWRRRMGIPDEAGVRETVACGGSALESLGMALGTSNPQIDLSMETLVAMVESVEWSKD